MGKHTGSFLSTIGRTKKTVMMNILYIVSKDMNYLRCNDLNLPAGGIQDNTIWKKF